MELYFMYIGMMIVIMLGVSYRFVFRTEYIRPGKGPFVRFRKVTRLRSFNEFLEFCESKFNPMFTFFIILGSIEYFLKSLGTSALALYELMHAVMFVFSAFAVVQMIFISLYFFKKKKEVEETP